MRDFFHNNKNNLLISGIVSVVISLICYCINNLDYPFKVDTFAFSLYDHCWPFKSADDDTFEDVVFINTSYDKMIIQAGPDSTSRTAITDRKKIAEFLSRVKDIKYRQLFIDIRFEEPDRSPYDSLLAERILETRNIIIPKHWNLEKNTSYKTIDNRLDSIARFGDFGSSKISSGFYKYTYLQEDENSIAMEMYHKSTNRNIKKFGIFYFDGWRLCQNSQFLVFNPQKEEEPDFEFNLGAILYDEEIWLLFQTVAERNVVVVGNMQEDKHDTYLGSRPGPHIHYMGYKNLIKGNHITSGWVKLAIFLLYFIISLTILQNLLEKDKRFKIIQWIEKKPFVYFFYSLLGFGTMLLIFSFLLYGICGIAYNIFIPSLIFTVGNYVVQFIVMYRTTSKLNNKGI